MSELLKKERDFVVPGEEIVQSMDFLPGRNCFREGDRIIAKKIGLVSVETRVISVVPLNGAYIPRSGDMVVGEVIDIQNNGWVVWVDAPHDAFLPLSGVREYIDTQRSSLSRYYDIGDVIYAKVHGVSGSSIYLSMQDVKARKFRGGRIITINPAKVPRLIGKQGSMINMIKDLTLCRVSVGQNGKIWLEGEKTDMFIQAVQLIEQEAASEGLTDKVAHLLGGEAPKEVVQEVEGEVVDV